MLYDFALRFAGSVCFFALTVLLVWVLTGT